MGGKRRERQAFAISTGRAFIEEIGQLREEREGGRRQKPTNGGVHQLKWGPSPQGRVQATTNRGRTGEVHKAGVFARKSNGEQLGRGTTQTEQSQNCKHVTGREHSRTKGVARGDRQLRGVRTLGTDRERSGTLGGV